LGLHTLTFSIPLRVEGYLPSGEPPGDPGDLSLDSVWKELG